MLGEVHFGGSTVSRLTGCSMRSSVRCVWTQKKQPTRGSREGGNATGVFYWRCEFIRSVGFAGPAWGGRCGRPPSPIAAQHVSESNLLLRCVPRPVRRLPGCAPFQPTCPPIVLIRPRQQIANSGGCAPLLPRACSSSNGVPWPRLMCAALNPLARGMKSLHPAFLARLLPLQYSKLRCSRACVCCVRGGGGAPRPA